MKKEQSILKRIVREGRSAALPGAAKFSIVLACILFDCVCFYTTYNLLLRQSQLNELYSYEGAATILNNCSSYAYFPGGMDLATCQSISRRLDKPMTEVMYMPGGNVIIMQNGEKPVVVPRYDTFHSKLYLDYQEFVKNRQGRIQAEK